MLLCQWVCLAAAGCSLASRVDARELVMGFNVVNPMEHSQRERDAILDQLAASGITVVRCKLKPVEGDIDFAKALYERGIRLVLIVEPQYPLKAVLRPYQPKLYPGMWSGHPLSSADASSSEAFFKKLIAMLEVRKIVLEAMELGNEINWSAFNAEFPVPGKGRVLGLTDLYDDPEGQRIASGYIQYLKILAVLKRQRDQSTINRATPILSAGLSPVGAPRSTQGFADAVSINATLEFLRANGLDQMVDGYGIHFYPTDRSEAGRNEDLEKYTVSECRPAGADAGKPCWITEWGIKEEIVSCAVEKDESEDTIDSIAQELIRLSAAGRVMGAVYFAWNTDSADRASDAYSVFRCGRLTGSGKKLIAIAACLKSNRSCTSRVHVTRPDELSTRGNSHAL